MDRFDRYRWIGSPEPYGRDVGENSYVLRVGKKVELYIWL